MEKKKYLAPQVDIYAIDLSASVCTPGSIPVGGRVEEFDAAPQRGQGWDNYEN